MIPGLTVKKTADRETIRRWMLDPEVLQGVRIGLPSTTSAEIESRFKAYVSEAENVFWLVRWQREERGIVLMEKSRHEWETHICLKRQSHTRDVMQELFRLMAPATFVFTFSALHSRMERLADSLKFGPPRMRMDVPPGAAAPFCARRLRVEAGSAL